MVAKLSNEITSNMRDKTTEELLAIWTKHDRQEWSDQAFDAISQVLTERGVALPQQEIHDVKPSTSPEQKKKGMYKSNGWILLALMLVMAVINGSGILRGVVIDVFQTGLLVGAIICFIAAARIKVKV
jgi:hypothetical protein